MNDEDPFESPKLLLNRAQENLLDFKARQSAFFNTKPYARFVEIDPKTGHEIHKLRFTAKVPGSIRAVVADALNNIRHSLDHAVTASAQAVHVKRFKGLYFPFAKDADDFERVIGSKCAGVHPEVVDYIRGLKPYPGGHTLLSTLTKLSGANKHQLLAPVAAAGASGATVRGFDINRINEFTPWPVWDAAKQELTLFRKRPGAKENGQVNFTVHIAFGPNAAKLEAPVWEMLNLFGLVVSGIVKEIEEITLRARPPIP